MWRQRPPAEHPKRPRPRRHSLGSLLTLAERIAAAGAPAAGLDVDGAVTQNARLGAAAKPRTAPPRPHVALRAQAPPFARPIATTSAPSAPAIQTKITSDTPTSAGKGSIAKAGFEAADAEESLGPNAMAAVLPVVASLPSGLDLTNAAHTLGQAVSAQTAAAKAPLETAPAAPEAGPISTGLRALAAKSSAAKAAAEDPQQNAASRSASSPKRRAERSLCSGGEHRRRHRGGCSGRRRRSGRNGRRRACTPQTPLAVSGVQKRTHLTVTGSRLFELTSSRALDALEAAPTAFVGVGPAIKAAAAVTARADSGAKPAVDAPPSTAAASINSRAVAADVVPVPAGVSVAVGDLADRLADEASSLAPSAASAPDATPARGPVKELQFQLEPADLGKVAVRLRMSTGRLTVDIGVASPGALVELEKQRDAMAAKLNTVAATAGKPRHSPTIDSRNT